MRKILYFYLFIAIVLSVYFFVFDSVSILAVSSTKSEVSEEYLYHVVKRGDTLEKIARRYGVTISKLREWNKIRGNRIAIGQKLIVGIKGKKKVEVKSKEEIKKEEDIGSSLIYVVKKGDTLEKIAKKYDISVEEIKALNRLKSDRIQAGQKLIIKKSKEEESTIYNFKKKEIKKPETEQEKEEYLYHVVKRGDTLEKIARRYGVTISKLREWNKIRGNRIAIGQKLIVGIKGKKKVEEIKKEVEKPLSDAEKIFLGIEKEYEKLVSNPQTTRSEWLKLISKYRRLYLLYPGSETAPKAILKTADIYLYLYKTFSHPEDLKEAIERYSFLIKNYKTLEAERAYYELIRIYEEDMKNKEKVEALKAEFKKSYPGSIYITKLEKKETPIVSKKIEKEDTETKEKKISKGDSEGEIKEKLTISPNIFSIRKILEVQPITGEDYSRVIINVSDDFEYQANILKGTEEKPPRIYVDIYPASIDDRVSKEIKIENALLTGIRVGQFNENTVRVVLDLNSLTAYKIFKLKEPYRLVLDLIGKERALKEVTSKTKESIVKKDKEKDKYINLARQFGLGIKRIVIDPGHGGEDPGAVGPKGLQEKDVTLKIAQLLAQKLKEKLNIEVILTRSEDKFISLIQRPAIANSKRADLFISLHTNASPDPHAKGIETYYLNFTTDPEAMRVAALENAASDKALSDLQDLIKAVLANTKLSESKLLAEKIQEQLVKSLKTYYPDSIDRGVKYAPFLVLVGTRMPAVLVEISFISNFEEENRLRNSYYLEMVAEGIAKGIEIYIQSLKFSQTYYNDKKS